MFGSRDPIALKQRERYGREKAEVGRRAQMRK